MHQRRRHRIVWIGGGVLFLLIVGLAGAAWINHAGPPIPAQSSVPLPAPPVTPRPPAPASQAAPGVATETWARAVTTWAQSRSARFYPDSARRLGEEGNVVLNVTIQHDGQVTGATIKTSTGLEVLDQAALALVEHAAAPAMPASLPDAPATISVPIRLGPRS